MKLATVAFIAVWLTIVVETTKAATGPIILTSKGKVSGWERISRGRIFQGWTKIPYAKPPINNLRFMPPQTIKKWQGILDATQDAPACMQNGNFMMLSKATISEDCLYLNIYRPKDHSLRYMPVLVYIHGGAFIGGAVGGRQNADYLMDEDVVLVEVSYRVNIFGFMSLNDDVVPGNNGMKDQVRALEWVKYNIRAFSGDPKNITVFGESAGGSSVHLLLKSPLSKDLINGAVSHSGTINPIWSLVNADYVKDLTLEAATIVGCKQSSSVELLKCLQDVEVDKLLQAFNQVNKLLVRTGFSPVIEPKTVKGAFATEDFSLAPSDKPWINTFTNGEYMLFESMLSSMQNVTEISKNVPAFLNAIMSPVSDPAQRELGATVLENVYFTEKNATPENVVLEISKMYGDECFTYPAMVTTENHSGPKWLGVLEYSPFQKPSSGADEVAMHALNIIFYFNLTSGFSKTLSPQFVDTSKRMIKYLVNFAYYRDPTPPGSQFVWPQFKTSEILRTTREGDVVGDQSTFNHYQKLKHVWDVARGWK